MSRTTVSESRSRAAAPAVEKAPSIPLSAAWQRRAVIESVAPAVDHGRFPIKRCAGEEVRVSAVIHADGADQLGACLQHRFAKDKAWKDVPLHSVNAGLDLWEGRFVVDGPGRYEYRVEGWVDPFATWRRKLSKKAQAGQDVALDLAEGARLIREAAARAQGAEADWLRRRVKTLSAAHEPAGRIQAALDEELAALMAVHVDRSKATLSDTYVVAVERERARFGAWYEMFPRSAGTDPSRSATFREAAQRLPYVAGMGFDVLYLPPIHPIGRRFRKGPNNNPLAAPGDPGSPWAIGSEAGGHKAIEPSLGTLQDFDAFVHAAADVGLEVALDLAFQCSPDHPYVREHPEWFRHRPDGSIQYAENPPKKYEDIYPLDFECADWQALWHELRDVVFFWVRRGVRLFRVDNPHTKPYRFWEWLIAETRERYPDVVFLAEAFTRPAVMRYLAKVGFSQSYTYFTWRNSRTELTQYLTELTHSESREYMRPNLFANTPDIFHDFLQRGGRAAFQIRLILAATLSASYGIYGPAFELCESRAVPGTEDYVDSEKYQVRVWDLDRPGNIRPLVAQVNRLRWENPALQFNTNLRFCPVTNDALLAYAKVSEDRSSRILVVVNLDPHRIQAGWVEVPFRDWGLPPDFEAHDLLTDQRFTWHGAHNFVQLDPQTLPAHILRLTHA